MKTHLSKNYGGHQAIQTDLYQLTMAYGYWKSGLYNRQSAFHLFYRKPPFAGNYIIAAGLELVADWLQDFSFSTSDIQYLGSLKNSNGSRLFDESFLNFLQRMQFSCDIHAVPEGTIVYPHQPILRIEGPLLQCQLIETALLSLINFSSLIATKSSRIVQAAAGDPVLEFGMRRAQGLDGAMTATRAAYIGGCHATSNVAAGKAYKIPVKGTHAHSWVMCFDEEIEAFRAYAQTMPDNCIFLVDTYDSIEGTKNAIKVGLELREQGNEMVGIRLDSGDLAQISIEARKLLDVAGFPNASIVASNDLDEYEIKKLKETGAKINVWGVGTRLSTSFDQPALGGVYKLAAIQDENGKWEYRMKRSEQIIKISNPGRLQTIRLFDHNHLPMGDIMHDISDPSLNGKFWDYQTGETATISWSTKENLLIPVFQQGEKVYNFPTLEHVRSYAKEQIALFNNIDHAYKNGLAKSLYDRKMLMLDKLV